MTISFARLSLLVRFAFLHLIFYSTKKRSLLWGGALLIVTHYLLKLIFLFENNLPTFMFHSLFTFILLIVFLIVLNIISLIPFIIGAIIPLAFIASRFEKRINEYTTYNHIIGTLGMSPFLDLKTLKGKKNVLEILTNGFIEALELLPEVYPNGKTIKINTHESVFKEIQRKFTGNPYLDIQHEPKKKKKIVIEKLLLCSSWKQIFSKRLDGRFLLRKSTHYKITVRIEQKSNLKGA